MPRKIFVNLPVRDLDRSKAFVAALGFPLDPRFTDATAACVVVSEEIYVMLLTHAKFKAFTPLPVADATQVTEVLVGVSCDRRAEVDEIVARAVAAGGRTFEPPQDYGFMYAHSFHDPDGHGWNWIWLDPSKQG